MFPILKKILSYFLLQNFKDTPQISKEQNEPTPEDKLYFILNNNLLNDVFNNPTSKIYIINVYVSSFSGLLDSVYIKDVNRTDLVAINLYGYFKDCYDLNETLTRLIKYIKSNKVSPKTQYDINELIDAICFVIDKRDNKWK